MRRPYSVLLPVGFALRPALPRARCALTAPFHCHASEDLGRSRRDLLSVALSLGSPPPGITRHRGSMEPGLSSPSLARSGGRPTLWRYLSSDPALPVQEEAEEDRTTLPFDLTVDMLGSETPLESGHRRLRIAHIIAETFEREQEAAIGP